MSQGPLYPNLSQKVQKEVCEMANCNLSCMILLGGLSVNVNHLKTKVALRNLVILTYLCKQSCILNALTMTACLL